MTTYSMHKLLYTTHLENQDSILSSTFWDTFPQKVKPPYPPESSCPIYWTYILYSLLQFEHMWRINLLVIIYINTSTIYFYKFGIKSAGWYFLWHPVNPRWQPLCRSDSTRSDRGSVTRTNCRWKSSIPVWDDILPPLYIDPGVNISYDILTPGSIYRNDILTPLTIFTPPPSQ